MDRNRIWNSRDYGHHPQPPLPLLNQPSPTYARVFRRMLESFRAHSLPIRTVPQYSCYNYMIPNSRLSQTQITLPACVRLPVANLVQPLLPPSMLLSSNRHLLLRPPAKRSLVSHQAKSRQVGTVIHSTSRTDESVSMRSSEQPSCSQAPVPLILPKAKHGSVDANTSVNIFRMILDEDHRTRQEQPVVDLEAEPVNDECLVTQSPAPKKRREDIESDDCVILDDTEIQPSTSKVSEPAKKDKMKKCGVRRSPRLPWNPLEATFHMPCEEKESGQTATARSEKMINLSAGGEGTTEKVPTLREVLEELIIPPNPRSPLEEGEIAESPPEEGEAAKSLPEEGELSESSEGAESGDNCVIDLTCEEELQLTLRSQEEGDDVIDLTAENEPSDSDSEVVCMEDLTVIDEEEITIIQDENEVVTNVSTQIFKSKKKTKKRRSTRALICEGIGRKPSKEDALSRSTKELTGVTPRYWERFTAAPQPSSSNAEIRVCSYNVLCELTTLKTMYLYRHLGKDDSALKWENRWPILEQELIRLNADIYGLQEVQYDHFHTHFRKTMSKVGYATFYKQRTRGLNDGCAVLVRKSKFDIINYRIVEYFVGVGTTMDRDQIGQIMRLRCRKTGQDIIYANTHLLFNSARGDIKIGQLAMLFANIQDVLKVSPCPVILNGDFNIEPMSYVYTYISESSVFLRGLPRNELSGQGEHGGPCVQASKILPSAAMVGRDSMFIDPKAPREVAADYFTHPLHLASVYHHFNIDGKKEVSTYHREVANPDFIFYSIEKKCVADTVTQVYELPELRLVRRLSLPDHETLRNTLGPWPNQYVPSDHIPLVADFILRKTEKKRRINRR